MLGVSGDAGPKGIQDSARGADVVGVAVGVLVGDGLLVGEGVFVGDGLLVGEGVFVGEAVGDDDGGDVGADVGGDVGGDVEGGRLDADPSSDGDVGSGDPSEGSPDGERVVELPSALGSVTPDSGPDDVGS